MQATVTRITSDGLVRVVVRRNAYQETLDGQHPDLNAGDRIEVKKVNGQLVRVEPKR